jgi:Domain of unknown function (DUF4082)
VITYTFFNDSAETLTGAGPTGGGTLGLVFSSNVAATLVALRLYSASGQGITATPVTIGLYTVSGSTLVHSETPSWSGAAGSGWIRAQFSSPPRLTASTNYTAAIYEGSGSSVWFAYNSSGWGSSLASGPLSATAASQSIYDTTTSGISYPTSTLSGWNWYLDVEIQPLGGAAMAGIV